MQSSELILVSEAIGYTFNNVKLLEEALTHRSLSAMNNERLEFLGDSILNFLVAEAVYQRFPLAKEGELSRLRANLVQGETLAEISQSLGLGKFLRLGPGEHKSGGATRISILADALEATIAAIYLDSNLDVTRSVLIRLFISRIESIDEFTHLKDPKTELQEYLQARKFPLPIYQIIKIEGNDHNQLFHVACTVVGLDLREEGCGTSRRRAEQQAAAKFLTSVQKQHSNIA